MVTGYGPYVGAPLASHPDVRKVAFTGEPTTGRLILRYATALETLDHYTLRKSRS